MGNIKIIWYIFIYTFYHIIITLFWAVKNIIFINISEPWKGLRKIQKDAIGGASIIIIYAFGHSIVVLFGVVGR